MFLPKGPANLIQTSKKKEGKVYSKLAVIPRLCGEKKRKRVESMNNGKRAQ